MADKKKSEKKDEEVKSIKSKSKPKSKIKKSFLKARVYIKSSYNNTHITITDPSGNVLAKSSAGVVGFKGSRKSTAYAATKAAEDALSKVAKFGVKEASVSISGAGMGRQAAVKGLQSGGLTITMLMDNTPIPHNGCRPRKAPRGS